MKNLKLKNLLKKVAYLSLTLNPLIVLGFCIFITPLLSWISASVLLLAILGVFPAIHPKMNENLVDKIDIIGFVLHVLMTAFALGFTIDAIWPNLYASIGQGISSVVATLWQLIIHNPWVFIGALIVVVLFQWLKNEIFILLHPNFNLLAVQRVSKDVKPWAVYLKVLLSANQVAKLESLLQIKFYYYKIFKRYFELVITEKYLINKERLEFKYPVDNSRGRMTVTSNKKRIYFVLSCLEEFSKRYPDEKNTKLVQEKLASLGIFMVSYLDNLIYDNDVVTENKKNEVRKEQYNFGIRLMHSPLLSFNNFSEISVLVERGKAEIKRQQEAKKRHEKELKNKRQAKINKMKSGDVMIFLDFYYHIFEELYFKHFFRNLSLKKFEEAEIITVSHVKGKANWSTELDIFFDYTEKILKKSLNDELIKTIMGSLINLYDEAEAVGDENLINLITKKTKKLEAILVA